MILKQINQFAKYMRLERLKVVVFVLLVLEGSSFYKAVHLQVDGG